MVSKYGSSADNRVAQIQKQKGFNVVCGNRQPNHGKSHSYHADAGLKKLEEDLLFTVAVRRCAIPS